MTEIYSNLNAKILARKTRVRELPSYRVAPKVLSPKPVLLLKRKILGTRPRKKPNEGRKTVKIRRVADEKRPNKKRTVFFPLPSPTKKRLADYFLRIPVEIWVKWRLLAREIRYLFVPRYLPRNNSHKTFFPFPFQKTRQETRARILLSKRPSNKTEKVLRETMHGTRWSEIPSYFKAAVPRKNNRL